MSVNTSDPLIGRLIDGRYQVRSRIARGGMATVYLATDLRLERRVAVKVMHGHLADDSQFKQRFIQEARSAARLAHPNVVNVFDQGQDDESAYLVMEYLPGITLRELLREYGSLTPQQTIDIAEAVLSGLAAAHKAGIVHRDLKPENVLLADDGRIKIGDFGLARAVTANTATGAALLGTIAYLSPELVTRGVADTRSDIYAVGIMVYEMLTGEQPFTGEQPMQIAYQHANESVPAPSSRNAKVPPALDELVLWATERDPERRPRDAREMLEQLKAVAVEIDGAGSPPTAQHTMVLPTGLQPQGRHPSAPQPPLRPFADDETQVLGRAAAAPSAAPVAADAATAEQPGVVARPKRRRRWIPVLVILVLLLGGGGAGGWWLLFGPGAHVTIPSSIAGMSPTEARAALVKLGLTVDPTNGVAFSTTVDTGAVAATKPGIGASVAKDSTVQLLVSQGPQPIDFTIKAGMSEDEAKSLIAQHWTYKGSTQRFDDKAAKGTVLDALDGDGKSLLGVDQYGEKQTVSLLVSAGQLPAVAGKTFDEASRALAAVDVTAKPGESVYSDTVPDGSVIGIQDKGPFAPGQSITLQLSQGPQPVQVPAIVGLTWGDAKAALDKAGLKYDYNHGADLAPGLVTVKSTDPKAGTTVHRGDTIRVRFTN